MRDAVRNEPQENEPLGKHLRSFFDGIGLDEDILEWRGQPAEPGAFFLILVGTNVVWAMMRAAIELPVDEILGSRVLPLERQISEPVEIRDVQIDRVR
jgi:hypothetical protein